MNCNLKNFDWTLYGTLIRKARRDAGCPKAEDFGKILKKNTGVYISKNVVYKIETGRQIPDAEQFMALNLFAFNQAFPPEKIITFLLG